MKQWILWFSGFLIMFVVNVLVESIVLPSLNLDNTARNDIYFQSWWAAVAVWFVFGHPILWLFQKRTPQMTG